MEPTEKQIAVFLKKFGNSVEKAIYEKYSSKSEFARETGILRKSLHLILTGKDTKLSTIYKLSRHLDIKPEELFPKDG